MFDNVTTRFRTYREAYKVLTRKRSEVDAGTYDARDYQIKSKPLAFSHLAEEWLAKKSTEIRSGSMMPLRNALRLACEVWGDRNIKSIKYAQVEDFQISMGNLAPKTRKNLMDVLRQFWTWVGDRYDIPAIKWPKMATPEMKFRKTISLPDQEAILDEVEKITRATRPRAWLAIKWLATYISIRPAEMLSLTEGQVDRGRGLLVIPHPKERRPKVVPLLDEDRALLAALPLAFDQNTPFFRHEKNASPRHAGKKFGPSCLYKDWKAACRRLGIEGVDLYGGTKHSTAMGLRDVATFEEVRKMTGHTTNKAFDRYLQLEGEKMKELLARRQPLAQARPDNGLTMGFDTSLAPQVINFTLK